MSERYVVDRRLDAPADAVLAAIREAAGSMRFTDLPKPLRGGRGLTCRVRGTRFTVRFDTLSDGDLVDLRGAVLRTEDGATRVHASAEDDRNAGATVAGIAVLALVLWLLRVEGAGWVMVFAACMAVALVLFRGGGKREDARAAYLAEWLNGVLDRFPTASAVRTGDASEPAPSRSG